MESSIFSSAGGWPPFTADNNKFQCYLQGAVRVTVLISVISAAKCGMSVSFHSQQVVNCGMRKKQF